MTNEFTASITIELACRRKPGRVTLSIEGWVEGASGDLSRLFLGGSMLDLSEMDPRLQGNASIPRLSRGATRCELQGSGPILVEGRAIGEGDRVRITTGGKIAWSR
jgi:hypothetical protein